MTVWEQLEEAVQRPSKSVLTWMTLEVLQHARVMDAHQLKPRDWFIHEGQLYQVDYIRTVRSQSNGTRYRFAAYSIDGKRQLVTMTARQPVYFLTGYLAYDLFGI